MTAFIRIKHPERRDCTPTPGEVLKVDMRVRDRTGTKIDAGGGPRRSGVIPDNIARPVLEGVKRGVICLV